MQTIFHKADSRGQANHGWLNARHTFSFAGYNDPSRVHFGVLRVLNDDRIAGGGGFGMHPHNNMEIITIPLTGSLEHKDSMGNHGVIKAGEIQVMSAGTGVEHSEFNASKTEECNLLQIWLFPKERNVTPRYDQIQTDESKEHNNFSQVLSPDADDEGTWIHQDAWFSIGSLDAGTEISYKVQKEGNGVYAFIISGVATINNQPLEARDGMGISGTDLLTIKANGNARILLMDVPMR